MASRAARRIVLNHRWYLALSLLALSACAQAGWENTRLCRLGDDRVLIIAGPQRFVLSHGAAWELVDPSQKESFAHWLSKEKLDKDLGILIANAPRNHEVPLAGELDATDGAEGTNLVFKLKTGDSKPITVSATDDGGKLDSTSTFEFNQVAKLLGKPPSTLLVLLADKSEKLSAGKAWGLVLARLKAKSEFFAFIDKTQGLLWVRKISAAAPSVDTTAKPTVAEGSATEVKVEKPKAAQESADTTPLLLVGIASVVLGGGVGFLIGRRKMTGPVATAPELPKFIASADEIELVEKVRAEVTKLKWPADRVPTAEEVVVGQMIERYNRFPSLHEEVEKLRSYQQFKESHDLFQSQIDKAVAESKNSHRKSEEIAALLHLERAKSEKTSGELQLITDRLGTANAELKKATLRISDLERSDQAFQAIYSELINRTGAVCHDLVLTRPRGDAWALAFVYLVDYSLSYLGLARQCNDQRVFDAMLLNLSRLSEAMSKAFPDRKLVIDPWQRAVKAMGDPKSPTYDQKPHPHVDSLSQIILTVRETGPSLSEFREYYAPSDSGLHIIRPA